MTTHGLPSWLQKELDHFGILTGYGVSSEATLLDYIDPLVAEPRNQRSWEDYRPCNEAVGWKPSYLGEEPPF